MTTRRIVVRGRVQGVGYRNWIKREARRLGLDGWVRNRSDGSVEILAQGEETALDALLVRCRRGPPSSVVEQVESHQSSELPDAPGFVRRPTA